MSDHDALRRAVCAAPLDPFPREVLADWLEERDDADGRDRARLIRLQLRAARLPEFAAEREAAEAEADRLLARHGVRWARTDLGDRFADLAPEASFRGGFVESVKSDADRLAAAGEALWSLVPLTTVWLTPPSDPEAVTRLAATPALTRLRSLAFEPAAFGGPALGDSGLADLLASPHLAGLRHLDVSGQRLTNAALATLAGWAGLGRLESLGVGGNRASVVRGGGGIDADGLATLLAADLSALRGLDLAGLPLGEAGVGRVADAAALARLERLGLAHCGAGCGGAARLAEAGGTRGLRALDVRSNNVGRDGLVSLAQSESLTALAELDLSGNRPTDAGVAALAASHRLGRLRALSARRCGLGDVAATELARSPRFPLLARLDLRHNDIRARGARALAGDPALAGLRLLDLRGNRMPARERRQLRHLRGRATARI